MAAAVAVAVVWKWILVFEIYMGVRFFAGLWVYLLYFMG